jgi:hypothetical protein
MKKLTINNIIWTILLIIIGFEIYGYISDYFKLQDYKYGKKYNDFRLKHKIPLLTDKIEPLAMYADENYGMIWINDYDVINEKEKLIHTFKIIDASEDNGWMGEEDVFKYYIDKSSYYVLEIKSKIKNDSVLVNGIIKIVYKKEKTNSKNNETILNTIQLDSIRKEWKIK